MGGSTVHVQVVDPRNVTVRKTVTPVVSSGVAYTAGDAVGGLMTFSAVNSASGAPIIIDTVVITDKGDQKAALNLVLFDRTFTATTDNLIFDPTDADMLNLVGMVPIVAGDYGDWSDNAAAFKQNIYLVALPNGTDLFGQLYTTGTPTYTATSDLSVILTIRQL